MGATKDLAAMHGRLKSRSANLERYGKDYADGVKELLSTLDKCIDAIDLAESDSENKDKGVKERQSTVNDVIDKQRKKFAAAISACESAMHQLTAAVQLTQGQIDDAEKEAKKIEVKVK